MCEKPQRIEQKKKGLFQIEGTLTMFIPPINSHGLYPQTPPIDASDPPSSGVVTTLYHHGGASLPESVRSFRSSRPRKPLEGLDSIVGCSCSKDQSAVSVPVSTRLLPLTSFFRHLTVCRIAASSLMVESRSFYFLKRILLRSHPPQAETLVIRYHIVNGSFIVRKKIFPPSENYFLGRFPVLFQISDSTGVCGPIFVGQDRAVDSRQRKVRSSAKWASSFHAHWKKMIP